MKNARTTALYALDRCFRDGAWSSQILNKALDDLSAEKDKTLASYLTLGVLQNYILLDYVIDKCLNGNKKLDLTVRNTLRLGAYQLLFSDKIPARAAVNESVKLCRTSGYSSACGLVNAVLRKISDLGMPEVDDPAIRYSHPKWFVDRIEAEHGYTFTEALLQANNTPPQIEYHPAFAEGETYVQDGAAYEAVRMAEPQPGMRVLDACAAPGGKSFTSAVLMDNQGSILSCDIHEKKLALVRNGAERLGIRIIDTRCANASEFHREWEEAFDLVIADVPCSGFGVIRKKPEIRMKTETDVAAMPAVQRAIAHNLARYVAPGGKMLYSTCTIFREENEDIAHTIPGFQVLTEKTFWPHINGTDGFYACILRKEE